MKTYLLAIALTLTGCPVDSGGHHLGDVGCFCKPDGTCNGPLLECRDAPVWLGVPVNEPSCMMKGSPR